MRDLPSLVPGQGLGLGPHDGDGLLAVRVELGALLATGAHPALTSNVNTCEPSWPINQFCSSIWLGSSHQYGLPSISKLISPKMSPLFPFNRFAAPDSFSTKIFLPQFFSMNFYGIVACSVARWFWVKIPKIGHKPPDFITRFFLKKWKIPRFWAKIPSIFCVWNKVKLVYFSFVYHISFEITRTWQLLVAFWLLFTIFLLLWLLLVNLRCEFQKLKRRDKLMNLFANRPDPVLAIQDILRWQIHFLNWLVSVKFLMILKKFQKLLLGLPFLFFLLFLIMYRALP